jgi:3-oxoacyl-[acyl-carrier-protein] synthase II
VSDGRRVVVTGAGAVSPLGWNRHEFAARVLLGTCGISTIGGFDTAPYPCKVGAEVKELPVERILGKRGLRYMNWGTRLLACAAQLALDDAGYGDSEVLCAETGLLVGSELGNFPQTTSYNFDIVNSAPRDLTPMASYDVALNSSVNYVSVKHRLLALARLCSQGTTSSTDALGDALEMIRRGPWPAILAGGVEQLSLDLFLMYLHQGRLAPSETPDRCVPFGRGRVGTILGEGAALLLLEEAERAIRRGCAPLGELLAYREIFVGADDDTTVVSRGATCVQDLLDGARVRPEEVGFVAASACSDPRGDWLEAGILHAVLPGAPVSALKSLIGETAGASGAFLLLAVLASLEKGLVFPTPSHVDVDPDCRVRLVYPPGEACTARRALITSLDVAGHFSCLLVGAWEDGKDRI